MAVLGISNLVRKINPLSGLAPGATQVSVILDTASMPLSCETLDEAC
jgi:hypothetical protein